ncbi:alpha,alpha-trehalase TreF [Entomobacter blattae]|uniref:Periplasmic trehalase n=1 Tax=Entomobacter blattae TaxID=2762277 RepID=A0A7H1NQG8_9PROT|nr:alpha,alpha-trehalase TreF [Entomobacter blattae]QNT78028.1 Periplasmic trehalase [Entomobacter blattae]
MRQARCLLFSCRRKFLFLPRDILHFLACFSLVFSLAIPSAQAQFFSAPQPESLHTPSHIHTVQSTPEEEQKKPSSPPVADLASPKKTEAKHDSEQQDLTPPSMALGELFAAIGQAHIFTDAKTVADIIPDRPPATLLKLYNKQKQQDNFNLKDFVAQHFTQPPLKKVSFNPRPDMSVLDYIADMWEVLKREADRYELYSSLLPLPKPYIVPGGRFSEIYYWDSYFTMIGLYEAGKAELLRNMVIDMASLIDRYGHIPNGNRTYYLSRSQPPFFALMVDLLAEQDGQKVYLTYLPELQREYDYWMNGAETLKAGKAYRHVVRLADNTVMNRHWDDMDTPRDESYPQDIHTAQHIKNRPAAEIYRNLRAGSETGWDFSSRWLTDQHTLGRMNTTELLPIELNSLMAHLEQVLAHAYLLKEDPEKSLFYERLAQKRITALNTLLWDEKREGYFDYNWTTGQHTPVYSAAMVVPLFLHLASPQQSQAVAQILKTKLLKNGGLVATDQNSGQQWDFPNGWAPLEWMAVKGLNAYGQAALARDIATRWMTRVIATYEKSGVLLEKYDVVAKTISPVGGKGGGEYPMQVGFGWTNGTLLGLMNRYPEEAAAILKKNPHAAPTLAVKFMPPIDAFTSAGHSLISAQTSLENLPAIPSHSLLRVVFPYLQGIGLQSIEHTAMEGETEWTFPLAGSKVSPSQEFLTALNRAIQPNAFSSTLFPSGDSSLEAPEASFLENTP